MATNTAKPQSKAKVQVKAAANYIFDWKGQDRQGRPMQGEMRAENVSQVVLALRRQGTVPGKIRKRKSDNGSRIRAKDIAIFTRQMATMIRAGIPLLQAFEVVSRGNPNPRMSRMLDQIRLDIETGTSMSEAFRKFPVYFNALYCNLIGAGESAGILDQLLDRLAAYLEKTEAMKSKIKSALMYPIAVLAVAFVVVAVIMIFVIPSFKEVFSSFGADLPVPTLVVIAMSEFFISYWWLIFGGMFIAGYSFWRAWTHVLRVQIMVDKALLKMPIFGVLVEKSCIARWTRTLSTMFAAGVPLVDALRSVSGAAGNYVFQAATLKIQHEVSTGASLTAAMAGVNLFPSMVLQMSGIGEESGSLDNMLSKAADFYDAEVDDMVAGISSLMEPIFIVVLGGIIGTIVVAMYLPIFKIGQVI